MSDSKGDVRQFYDFLDHKGLGATEVRVFSADSKPMERTFTKNASEFEAICNKFNGVGHIYAGVNPRHIDKGTNEDIKVITDIVFDIEYDHPKDTMITQEQLDYTLKKLDEVLTYYNYNDLFVVMTGNGVQIHFKIKSTPKSDVLQSTHKKYVEYFRGVLPENIRIDALCDPARIVRIPGTYNIKGGQKRLSYIWKNGTGRSTTFLNKFSEMFNTLSALKVTPVESLISQDNIDRMIGTINKYPCYKTLFERKAGEGEHHFTAVRLIAFLKSEKFSGDEILEILQQWDETNDKYEGRKLLQNLVWKQEKKLYNFGCGDEMLKRFCDAEHCPLRQKEDIYVPLVDMSRESETFLAVNASAPPEGRPELLHGWADLDKQTWGLQRGELTVLASYASVGKTAAACQIGSYNARRQKKVLYLSSESKYNEIYARMVAETFNIENFHFRNKHFTEAERETLKSIKKLTEKWTLWICDEPCPTREQVEVAVRQVKPDIVILDYVQRCSLQKDDSDPKGLREWMKHMKTLAHRYNCAVIVLSQLRRKPLQDGDPNLGDLLGSSALEQEGDNVILLSTKPNNNPFGLDEERIVKWHLAKGRNIGTGRLLFTFVGKYCRFIECTNTGEINESSN